MRHFPRVLDQCDAVKLLLHGKGLHDLFNGEIYTAYQRHALQKFIALFHDAAADVVGEENADEQNEEYQRDDAKARDPSTQNMRRKVSQETVDDAEQSG